jgi:glycosyltransferase involved in cell wall biosynthesis
MPAISVIIPVYNRKTMLKRAVDSVLQQKHTDFECIVVDDGSTDRCDELPCLHDKRVRYIRLEQRNGVAKARNRGVAEASGQWIAFLDSDDEWFPKKLLHQVAWIEKNPIYRIVQTNELWIRNGIRVNPPVTHKKRCGDLFNVSCERCMITPSSVLLCKALFIETGGFNEALPACEDYDLWLRITAHYPIGLIDEALLKRYGGHSDQLSSSVPILDRFRVRSLLGLLAKERLTDRQIALVKKQLVKKATILSQGYRKRGNEFHYEHYRTIAERYGCTAKRSSVQKNFD